MSDLYELRCKECGKTWGNSPRSFCEDCFSPLEVSFDYDSLKKTVHRENLAGRAFNMWRYAEFLPLQEGYAARGDVGGTPLVPSTKLAARWGVKNLFIKNDAVCFPSLSFKDRVVATALAAARRFGFQTVGCSSTGNLANAVAAQAAQQGFDACVFIPADLEPAKVPARKASSPSRGVSGAARAPRGSSSSPAPRDVAGDALEVHVIGQRLEEALETVEKELDQAILAGAARLRVVHGHGTGRLRDGIRKHFRAHGAVASVRAGDRSEGGNGATILELR